MSVTYIEAAGAAIDTPRDKPQRNVAEAMLRGMVCRCPACGKGKLFNGFLTVSPTCSACGTELHHHRADDAPPYFTIMVVGHVVVPMLLWTELAFAPPVWLHMTIWPALTLFLSLALLPRIKGAVVGWQWALRMHGFGGETDD
ncbi:MAG: DUF983 domain-containing protein [Parvibaculum sp.]